MNGTELHLKVMNRRREFMKKLILHSAYTAPIVTSFLAADLVRAASCPGLGNCGKSSWAMSM
jgi:hypothetical protein